MRLISKFFKIEIYKDFQIVFYNFEDILYLFSFKVGVNILFSIENSFINN